MVQWSQMELCSLAVHRWSCQMQRHQAVWTFKNTHVQFDQTAKYFKQHCNHFVILTTVPTQRYGNTCNTSYTVGTENKAYSLGVRKTVSVLCQKACYPTNCYTLSADTSLPVPNISGAMKPGVPTGLLATLMVLLVDTWLIP